MATDKITRREFVRKSIAAGAAVTGAAVLGTGYELGHAAGNPQRPNILFILTDQLKPSVLSCYGGPVPTPNIDRLAREGVMFTNAVVPCGMCTPCRASIAMGQYPHTHGITFNVPAKKAEPYKPGTDMLYGITNEDITTGKLLNAAGYQTNHYGKWHLTGEALAYYPDQFRMYIEYPEAMASVFEQVRRKPKDQWMDYYGWALPTEVSLAMQEAVKHVKDPKLGASREYYAKFTTQMGRLLLPSSQVYGVMATDRSVERLQNLGPDPFMLTCSFLFPHDPTVVPSPYYEMFTPEEMVLPENYDYQEPRFEEGGARRPVVELGETVVREFMRIYYGKVKLVDDQIGRLLDALEATGRAENTVIVFAADGGAFVGGHGMIAKALPCFYEDIIHVPLIISYPRGITPRQSDLDVNLVDLMPTFLDFAGEPIPDHCQGTSLAPYLRGESDGSEIPAYTFSEFGGGNRQRIVSRGSRLNVMIRGEGWKYGRYTNGDETLYDLENDPGETQNLIDSPAAQERKVDLTQKLDEWVTSTEYAGS